MSVHFKLHTAFQITAKPTSLPQGLWRCGHDFPTLDEEEELFSCCCCCCCCVAEVRLVFWPDDRGFPGPRSAIWRRWWPPWRWRSAASLAAEDEGGLCGSSLSGAAPAGSALQLSSVSLPSHRRTMQQFIVVRLLVVWLVCLAEFASLLAVSHPEVGVQIGLPHPGLDLNPEPQGSGNSGREAEVGGLADEVVWTWNEQVLEWDELTRCIRGSETGNAIERWLDCLESLEEAPVLKPLETGVAQQSGVSADIITSDAEVNGSLQLSEDNMEAFYPLSEGSAKGKSFGSSVGNLEAIEGLGSGTEDTTVRMGQARDSDETQELEAAAVGEDQEFGTVTRIEHGDEAKGVAQFRPGSLASADSEMSESTEMSSSQISSGCIQLQGEGDARGATDVRRSSSKWGTEISSVSGDSRFLASSVCNDDVGCLEVPKGAQSSTASTRRSQNLLDALKLAACLGAAVTLMWRKRDRFMGCGKEKQPVLSERAMEYPCPSATGFSMTGLSSSNSDIGYPNVKAGSLSTPLGMAIATVMAEALEQEHSERAPRTADELSKLLEAAMTESLSPVMGSECPGFVEQFKQSFRCTYRLLGSVRNAGRDSAAPAFPTSSRGFSQRRGVGPSRRYSRRTDDEEDDYGGLTSSSRGAYLDPVSESDSRFQSYGNPDSEAELAEQLSKLTVSAKRSETGAKSRYSGTVAPRTPKGGLSDGDNSSHIDQVLSGEFDDVSSPLRRDISEGLPEKDSGDGGSQVHRDGVRSRWGRGGLEQLANVWGAEGVASQSASQQIGRLQGDSSLESGDLDLAMQPFGVIPPGQLVAASESGLSHYGGETHYKQRKIVLMEQEMRLRKMELAYKFRDLNLKEANLHLSSETNSLMRENVDLGRNKAEFKEAEYQERKLIAAYTVFAKRCADEMVAGLCVMLCALFFGAWKYSYDRLVDVVSACQPTLYEPSNSYVPGFNKVINSLNHMTSKLHMFACEVTVASRMFLGLGIISVVAASLLRKSVASNSQAMPATILIVVLGGMCGFAGKFAVDSMGGSGYHWLLLWEIFCLVHTAATCFTGTLYRILNGASPSATGKRHRQPYFMQPWLRLFWFHVTTVLVLPILAGLLPFAHVREIVEVLGSNLWNLTYSPIESYLRKTYQFSFP